MNVQASFNFLVASSVTLEYLISLFYYSFSPPLFQRLASSLFFSRLLAYFLHILHLALFIYRAQIFAPT